MVIGKAMRVHHLGPASCQLLFETGRHGDARHRHDTASLQVVQFVALGRKYVRQVARRMTAFDNFCRGVPLAYLGPQGVRSRAVRLRNEDEAGPTDVAHRLTQDPARQHLLVAERIRAVHQHNIEAVFERHVLKAIVQHERIAAQPVDRVAAALDAILIHQHRHIRKIGGQHVGLVTAHGRVQQKGRPIRHHARRPLTFAQQQPVGQARTQRVLGFLIPATQNRHAASGLLQLARKNLHDGGLARTPHRQVANTDNLAPQRVGAEYPLLVKE